MDGTSEFIKRTIETYNDPEDVQEVILVLQQLRDYFEDDKIREWLRKAASTIDCLDQSLNDAYYAMDCCWERE